MVYRLQGGRVEATDEADRLNCMICGEAVYCFTGTDKCTKCGVGIHEYCLVDRVRVMPYPLLCLNCLGK